MRVLLEECLPRQLAGFLPSHDVTTVAARGWAGFKNGQLLAAAADSGFDVFLTADQHLHEQQNLRDSPLGVVVVRAGSTRLADLAPCGDRIEAGIAAVDTGTVLRVEC